jgi:hypothetical protein
VFDGRAEEFVGRHGFRRIIRPMPLNR